MGETDPRFSPLRDDLAGESLRGTVERPRFVAGTPAQVVAGLADLKRTPDASSATDTQLLRGEVVTLFEDRGGWAWVQNRADDYVGYLPAAALSAQVHEPTHRVIVRETWLYPEPKLKTPPIARLSFLGAVAVVGVREMFVEIEGGGFLVGRHLAPLNDVVPDYVATAELFLGAPYLWGGKGAGGLDCSGLVQLALKRAGLACPRDTDVQEHAFGKRPWDSAKPPQRGELIFMAGHVAIALDGERILHANAHHMLVAVEPWKALAARLAARGEPGFTTLGRP